MGVYLRIIQKKEIFDYFHGMGVSTICLTKGKHGVKLSDKATGVYYQQALLIEDVKDTTGAGDAFWTGFLFAKLKQRNLEDCLSIAQRLASIKLQHVGRLPDNIDIIEKLQ